jgi:hypothetical protein
VKWTVLDPRQSELTSNRFTSFNLITEYRLITAILFTFQHSFVVTCHNCLGILAQKSIVGRFCKVVMAQENLHSGVAFAITTLAGLFTALGGSIVFHSKWTKYATRKTLAAGLGLSAGVMTYVSFAEVIHKAQIQFEAAGHSQKMSVVFSTIGFFGGVGFVTVRMVRDVWHVTSSYR